MQLEQRQYLTVVLIRYTGRTQYSLPRSRSLLHNINTNIYYCRECPPAFVKLGCALTATACSLRLQERDEEFEEEGKKSMRYLGQSIANR